MCCCVADDMDFDYDDEAGRLGAHDDGKRNKALAVGCVLCLVDITMLFCSWKVLERVKLIQVVLLWFVVTID